MAEPLLSESEEEEVEELDEEVVERVDDAKLPLDEVLEVVDTSDEVVHIDLEMMLLFLEFDDVEDGDRVS